MLCRTQLAWTTFLFLDNRLFTTRSCGTSLANMQNSGFKGHTTDVRFFEDKINFLTKIVPSPGADPARICAEINVTIKTRYNNVSDLC